MLKPPRIGDIISFSAGSQHLSPSSFRVIRPDKNRLVEAAAHYPELATFLRTQPLMIINCYPATLGHFPNTVFVDTYLQSKHFSRALLLAQETGFSACILGQPLLVAELLRKHESQGLAFPRSLLLGLGGYYCPLSLETFLLDLLEPQAVQTMIFHAYGMAEADFACLLGRRIDTTRQEIPYKTITSHVKAECRETILHLIVEEEHQQQSLYTGDIAWESEGFFYIQNAQNRLSNEIKNHLESWKHPDWQRYTGYLHKEPDNLFLQLREGVPKEEESEVSFFSFCDRYGMDWSEKPTWR